MTYPRAHLVDAETPCFYHLISRCVRRAWLCGVDSLTGQSFEHRRQWVEDKMLELAQFYSVEIFAYTVMSNHYHLVIFYHPLAPDSWSDEEVAERWLDAHPPHRNGQVDEAAKAAQMQALLDNPDQVQTYRERLGSLSWYMRSLNHPLACRANREDDCTGHFWEGRFKSAVLLDEPSVLACMAYVDLNPVRAKIAERLEACQHTSIKRRLEKASDEDQALSSFGADNEPGTQTLSITFAQYRSLLIDTGLLDRSVRPQRTLWLKQVLSMRLTQRAYGSKERLEKWADRLNQRWIKAAPLPS